MNDLTPLISPPSHRIVGGLGHLLEYPFGVVLVRSGSDDIDEATFRDLASAQRDLGIPPDSCVLDADGPERRFRIILSVPGKVHRSGWLHSYCAAVVAIEQVCWNYRLDHHLEAPPVDFQVEDARTGAIIEPQSASDLSKNKDRVFAFPNRKATDPDYLILLAGSSVALWTSGHVREQWWRVPDVMLHFCGLSAWPSAALSEPALPTYAIIRQGDVVVAGDYHSLLHAGRLSQWLYHETKIETLVSSEPVSSQSEVWRFRPNLNIGDIIQFSATGVEYLDVELTEQGGRLKRADMSRILGVSRDEMARGGMS
jgi:hypothetical protein